MNAQLNVGSKNFIMEIRALTMRRVADVLQLTPSSWGSLLKQTHTKHLGRLQKNWMLAIQQLLTICIKLKNQKVYYQSLFCTSFWKKKFMITLWHVTKNRFSVSTDAILHSDWTEAKHRNTFSKLKLHLKNVMVTGGWQVELSTATSWIPAKASQHWSIARKSTKCTKNFQHLHPTLVNQKGLILLHNKVQPHVLQMAAGIERTGLQNSTHSAYLSDLSPTNYHFFKHLDNFLQEVFDS